MSLETLAFWCLKAREKGHQTCGDLHERQTTFWLYPAIDGLSTDTISQNLLTEIHLPVKGEEHMCFSYALRLFSSEPLREIHSVRKQVLGILCAARLPSYQQVTTQILFISGMVENL